MNLDLLGWYRKAQREKKLDEVFQQLMQDRPAEALALTQKAIRTDPDFWRYHFYQGRALKELGRADEATKAFRTAIDRLPDSYSDEGRCFALADNLSELGNAAENLPCLQKLARHVPHSATLQAILGMAYLEVGDRENARKQMDLCASLQSTSPYYLKFACDFYEEEQAHHRIPEVLKTAIDAAPGEAPAYALMGNYDYRVARQPEAAVQYYRAALERVHPPIRSSSEAASTKDYIRAVFEADQGYPLSIKDMLIYAVRDVQTDQALKEAEALARQHLAETPGRPGALAALAYVLVQGDPQPVPEEATTCYEQALALQEDSGWRGNLAQAYFLRDQFAEAERVAKVGVQKYPDVSGHWQFLASSLAELGRLEEALEAANQAVALAPDEPYSWAALSRVHLHAARWEEAMTSLRQLVELDKDDLWAWNKLAQANVQLGRFDDAVQAYRELLTQSPSEADIWLDLAKVYLRMNIIPGAIAALEKALEGELTDEQRKEAEGLLAGLRAKSE